MSFSPCDLSNFLDVAFSYSHFGLFLSLLYRPDATFALRSLIFKSSPGAYSYIHPTGHLCPVACRVFPPSQPPTSNPTVTKLSNPKSTRPYWYLLPFTPSGCTRCNTLVDSELPLEPGDRLPCIQRPIRLRDSSTRSLSLSSARHTSRSASPVMRPSPQIL